MYFSVCKTKGKVCQWKCIPDHDNFVCECPDGFRLIGNTCSDINECAQGTVLSESSLSYLADCFYDKNLQGLINFFGTQNITKHIQETCVR